jgi:hypothetical protein
VGRFWSLLFLLVPVLGVLVFVVAAAPDSRPLLDHWLPDNINDHGYIIDELFNFILYLTGVIFIITGVLLFYFLWRYDGERNPDPVKFTHGSQTLEIIWSVLPAITLLFIAIYQMDAWAAHKMRRPLLEDFLRRRRPAGWYTGRCACGERSLRAGQRGYRSAGAKPGRAAQLFPAELADQAGPGTRDETIQLVSPESRGDLRPGLCRIVWLGAL